MYDTIAGSDENSFWYFAPCSKLKVGLMGGQYYYYFALLHKWSVILFFVAQLQPNHKTPMHMGQAVQQHDKSRSVC